MFSTEWFNNRLESLEEGERAASGGWDKMAAWERWKTKSRRDKYYFKYKLCLYKWQTWGGKTSKLACMTQWSPLNSWCSKRRLHVTNQQINCLGIFIWNNRLCVCPSYAIMLFSITQITKHHKYYFNGQISVQISTA